MDRIPAVMILITVLCAVGVSGLLYLKFLIAFCDDPANIEYVMDNRHPCYDADVFCTVRCEEYNDTYTGNLTTYSCVCEDGIYTQIAGSMFYNKRSELFGDNSSGPVLEIKKEP